MRNRERNYTVISDLTDREARDLDEYIECSYNCTSDFLLMIERRSEPAGKLFRGINFRKSELKVGYIYEHTEYLSSWSIKEEVAHSFAFSEVPEGYIEEVLGEWGYNYTEQIDNEIWEKAYHEFVAIVMILENGNGFVVNKHLVHEQYSKEEEVILRGGTWQFTSIQEIKNEKGQIHYEVSLSEVKKSVA